MEAYLGKPWTDSESKIVTLKMFEQEPDEDGYFHLGIMTPCAEKRRNDELILCWNHILLSEY